MRDYVEGQGASLSRLHNNKNTWGYAMVYKLLVFPLVTPIELPYISPIYRF